jgi:hypothetical protein
MSVILELEPGFRLNKWRRASLIPEFGNHGCGLSLKFSEGNKVQQPLQPQSVP